MKTIELRCKTRDGSAYLLSNHTCWDDIDYGKAQVAIQQSKKEFHERKVNTPREMFNGWLNTTSLDDYDLVEYGEIIKIYTVEYEKE